MSLLDQALEKYAEAPVQEARGPLVQSVDMLRRQLLRERRGELRVQAAGDWDEIQADIGKLIAFASLEAIRQIRESGNCPDTYTAITNCQKCGPVRIWPSCPPRVGTCVWCMSGLTAPAIPRD